MDTSSVPILPSNELLREAAIHLATEFHLPMVDEPPLTDLLLCLTTARLELRDMSTTMGPVYVDFLRGTLGYRRHHGGGRKQPLAKAIGLKHGATPTVLDATAGLGRDAFILASLGCHVQMVERSGTVAALLYDGLQRARQDAEIGTWVTERLQLIYQDAQIWLHQQPLTQHPEVIYLDPMYPHRQKSALVKKEMRLFRAVVGNDSDASSLLKTALECACRRVVVKRPKKAPTLNGRQPSFAIQSENTRFDVYIL